VYATCRTAAFSFSTSAAGNPRHTTTANTHSFMAVNIPDSEQQRGRVLAWFGND
jgi:hypothetical protein